MNECKKVLIDGVECVSFSKGFLEKDDKLIWENMPMVEFVKLLNNNGYTVEIDQETNYYKKKLNGSLSNMEYETDLDAYIDCFIHAAENKII